MYSTDDKITIVITTSPSRRHPSIEMIQETIRLLRIQLSSRILILVDGVRPEQEYLKEDYEEYKSALYDWSLTQGKIDMIIFDEFMQQSGMIKAGLHQVDTPLLLFIEHDFPVVGDIPWDPITTILSRHDVDLIRFYLEPRLEPLHSHLFLDKVPTIIGGVPLIRTGQWSSRPHIASTRFYRRVMFTQIDTQKYYIEDLVHGYFANAFVNKGLNGWLQNKMCIYYPEGDISRCKHLDGRLDEEKYEAIV